MLGCTSESELNVVELREEQPEQDLRAFLPTLVGLEPYPTNDSFCQFTHVPVYHQNKEGLCGFYMVHNAKMFVRSLVMAQDKFTQLLYLAKLKSGKEFTKSLHYLTDVLLRCRNRYILNDTDRADLEKYNGTLERSHVEYLMRNDPEILELSQNPAGIPVYFAKIEYSFGSLVMEREECLKLD